MAQCSSTLQNANAGSTLLALTDRQGVHNLPRRPQDTPTPFTQERWETRLTTTHGQPKNKHHRLEGCAPAVMVQILKVAMMLGWLRLVASSASRSIFCSASDIDSLIPGECSTTLMATSVLRHRPA